MKTIKTEHKLCLECMEEHDVLTVEVLDTNIFKGEEVQYFATYEYCEHAEAFSATEEMLSANDVSMKNAYRKKMGLLQTHEICAIRKKYGISQSDLATLLGWGAKTITRYESHQVQENAYDSILRKIDADPEWFCVMLEKTKDKFSASTYQKYFGTATQLFEKSSDYYLRKSIKSLYAKFDGDEDYCGNTSLNINKIVDVIRYYSNAEMVSSLFKVKLMKLLWYADALAFKRHNHSITGLAYKALPMGAVPIGYNSIIDLAGINCVEEEYADFTGYHFVPTEDKEYRWLDAEDIRILDDVIAAFGTSSKKEIVSAMHAEQAYVETAPYDVIQYKYAKTLSLD